MDRNGIWCKSFSYLEHYWNGRPLWYFCCNNFLLKTTIQTSFSSCFWEYTVGVKAAAGAVGFLDTSVYQIWGCDSKRLETTDIRDRLYMLDRWTWCSTDSDKHCWPEDSARLIHHTGKSFPADESSPLCLFLILNQSRKKQNCVILISHPHNDTQQE